MVVMIYLDYEQLNSETRGFRRTKPYPWANPEAGIGNDAYRALLNRLPPIELFKKDFGYERNHGQQGHDRYTLEYDESLPVDPRWHEFVAELRTGRYRSFLRKLYGFRPMDLRFHWHYTPNSCAVSPHCDSRGKIGSHIFYFNTDDDWKAEWGGQTLILDDHKRLNCKTAPAFDVFEDFHAAKAIGNRSLLFMRTPHSWHGVKAIDCPEGALRKVFIVVIRRTKPLKALRNFIKSGVQKDVA